MPGTFADLTPATSDAFQGQGFPPRFVTAFMKAAKASNCIVLSRPPGLAANALIDGGYDLKSYFNKAKSCDWGPMAGFVCRQPHFNKRGMAKVGDNIKYIASFEDEFATRFPEWVTQWNARRDYPHFESPDDVTGVALAYVQVSISEARLGTLGLAQGAPRNGILAMSPMRGASPNRSLVAVACDKACSVVAEFLLWETTHQLGGQAIAHFNVYTGRIWSRSNANSPWSAVQLTYAGGGENTARTSDQNTALTGLWSTQGLPPAPGGNGAAPTGAGLWTPVHAMLNPYPAYCPTAKPAEPPVDPAQQIDRNAWLNATTGDYDLFSVWPRLTFKQLSYWDLVRTSDLFYLKKSTATAAEAVFYAIPEKPCAVSAGQHRSLILEVATTPAEGLNSPDVEDEQLGSINSAIAYVAGLVNTYVLKGLPSIKGKQTFAPNACFHSDDGANPLFTDLEFPIGLFLPPRVEDATKKDAHGYLLASADAFVAVLKALITITPARSNPIFLPLNLLCFRELIRAANEGAQEVTAAFDARAQTMLNLLRPAPPRGPGAPEPAPATDWTFDLTKARAKFDTIISAHDDRSAQTPGTTNAMQTAQALAALNWADIGAPRET